MERLIKGIHILPLHDFVNEHYDGDRAMWGATATSLPLIGGLLSGKPEAYRYLQTSSASFPHGEEFLALARRTGRFSDVSYRSFQGGIAYLYILEVAPW